MVEAVVRIRPGRRYASRVGPAGDDATGVLELPTLPPASASPGLVYAPAGFGQPERGRLAATVPDGSSCSRHSVRNFAGHACLSVRP